MQRITGLTPTTHVQVTENGSVWYGEIMSVQGNSYVVRVGGADSRRTLPEASVTLHPTRVKMGLGAALPKYVGQGQYKKSHWIMRTDGLFNCIAVVAYHEASGYAAFTHFDTSAAFTDTHTGEEDDEGNPISGIELDANGLRVMKARLLQELGEGAGVEYYVLLGDIWRNPSRKMQQNMKRYLIQGLTDLLTPLAHLDATGQLTATWDPSPPFASLMA